MMRFNILLLILLALFVLAGALMVCDLRGQTKDFRDLTARVEILEKIIYDDKIKTQQGRSPHAPAQLSNHQL